MQAKNASRWRNVQSDFANIFYAVNAQKEEENFDFKTTFEGVLNGEVKGSTEPYKITFLNGTFPNSTYRFNDFKRTQTNSIVSYKLYDTPQDGVLGLLMYDVNGEVGPNVWGKDVFGLNIYSDRFEPFCKNDTINEQKQQCSKNGTGLCCSNYYLQGGSIEQ